MITWKISGNVFPALQIVKQVSKVNPNKLIFCKNCYKRTLFKRRGFCTSQHPPVTWQQPLGFDTGMKIYNPLVKDTVPLILHRENVAHWYACGPTVYDSPHIGHASSYIRLDIMKRILSAFFNTETVMIMGVTDIDDKIIHKANETGQSIDKITNVYEKEFFDSLAKFNVLPPNVLTRVTQHILPIINFVKTLDNKGLAYSTEDGSVYFDVKKYGKYHVFSSPIEEPAEIERGKKSNLDFALWKAQKPGEPFWESPWGKGRPGWHVECSAMASGIFGSNFDIHSGGEDLLIPHHENEIAQSCGYHGNSQWVNYWIHTGHLFLSGQDDKMSKSLKNVISIPELLERYSPNQFRMLCLLTHYRKRLEFNDVRMEKAVSTLNIVHSLLNRCDLLLTGQVKCQELPEVELYKKLQSTRSLVRQAFADDFNTPQALAHLMRLIKFINQFLAKEESTGNQGTVVQCYGPIVTTAVYLRTLLETLGLETWDNKIVKDSSDSQLHFDKAVESVVSTRDKIREFAKNKNFMINSAREMSIPEENAKALMKILYKPLWSMADQMRDELLANSNIQIQDKSSGSTWCKVESKPATNKNSTQKPGDSVPQEKKEKKNKKEEKKPS